MFTLEFLPKELEEIIYDYKTHMENMDKVVRILRNVALQEFMFVKSPTENGYTEEMNNFLDKKIEELKPLATLTKDNVYNILVETLTPDFFYWNNVGYGRDGFAKIEELPRAFVERFKENIIWINVGSGHTTSCNYTKIEDLPRDFVEQFKNVIHWQHVGSGYLYKNNSNDDIYDNYTKIENLPRDFVEQFKNNICWESVGSGRMDDRYTYSKIEDLPRDFVEQFKNKICWEYVGGGKTNLFYNQIYFNYTPLLNLPKDFIKQFRQYIIFHENPMYVDLTKNLKRDTIIHRMMI